MSWIFFSFIMFVGSNFLYLLIRKAQIEKMSTPIYSVSLFLIQAIAYFILALLTKTSLITSAPYFLLIIFTAFFWSYLGNFFSQKGILYSPNPGYSLILSKSYVILTTIAAYFIFKSELDFKKVVGIFIIIGFSALISISKEKKKSQLKWIFLSLGAFFCWAYGALISKHFLNLGLQPYTYLFYICTIVSFLNIAEAKLQKASFKLSLKQWSIFILIGIFATIFNLFAQFGYKYAPNPGYVSAINTSSIMSVTFFSYLLFKDELSFKKVVGIFGVIVGLIIMFI